jgi:hypothetical protein
MVSKNLYANTWSLVLESGWSTMPKLARSSCVSTTWILEKDLVGFEQHCPVISVSLYYLSLIHGPN